jgi:predicted O-linked N-acetylglucosamine transferase (SPINDLY family)/predicted SAM-dependent methyltransferase
LLTDKMLNGLLSWSGRYLGRRGHQGLAAQLFRASDDDSSFDHAKAVWLGGERGEAEILLSRLLEKEPRHPDGNNLMGVVLLERGEADAAEASFRKALAARPRFAAAHNNLGNVRQAQSDFPGAIECYRLALECDPDYSEALTNLGSALNTIGLYEEAERQCRRAVEIVPDFAGAWSNLGGALFSLGRGGEAVAAYREALRLDPSLSEALINLSLVLQEPGYLVGVVDYYEVHLKKNPNDYLAHVRIAQALQAQNKWDEGYERLLEALRIRPTAGDALALLGHNHAHAGDVVAAIDTYRRAATEGQNAAVKSVILFDLLYLDEMSGEAMRGECEAWAQTYARSLPYSGTFRLRRDRPLRIGYVSMDFAKHAVAHFLEPILSNHDRSEVFVVCYSTRLQPDAFTARFQELADCWRDISMMALDDVEELVHEDEIDILVDLSGFTSGNRLSLFARKPAPIQATYLGYAGTTGIAAIDYRIVDEQTDPAPLTESHFVEKLWRLPGCFVTYKPDEDAPDVASVPSSRSGVITYGSFNNALKITPKVIALWAAIMRATPGSRLVLKSVSFGTRRGKARVTDEFGKHGIDEPRLSLQDWHVASGDHLAAYSDIDVALDPFPYNGTTTTCEALWMGVPVVTLAGDRHSSRVGVSLLHCMGLDDLICASADAYVATAVALASDPERLRELRASLRDRMRRSPLLDHEAFTRKLEAAYREMWRIHEQESGVNAVEAVEPEGEPIRLHIGGQQPKDGWKILNINPGPHVDYVGDVCDLSGFPANSVAEVYASHVLEHVDQNSILSTLRGIRRVLRKGGGRLMISVPDLEVLCRQFLKEGLGAPQRVHIMRMMFGGQTDAHDFHKIGLYYEHLADLLKKAGFRNVERVESFGLFDDTSAYAPYGEPISLNVIATV